MKNLTKLQFLLSGLTALGITSASAEQNRFYVKGDVGGTSTRDVELREFFGQALLPNSQIELNPGMRFGVRGGYGVTDWLAGEVETGFTVNGIDSITGSTESHGTLANIPVLLNARLHLPESHRISPYIGAGVGISSTILTGNDIVIGTTRMSGSTADVVFAYQLFAGVDVAINDRMSVGLEYRFFHADSSNMSADLVVGTPTDRVKLSEIETHALTANFTWRF